MPDKNTTILCTAIISPTRDSAYLSITEVGGTTHRFDLTFSQMRLFSSQAADAVSKWPVKATAAA